LDSSQDQTRTAAEYPARPQALEQWGPFTRLQRVGQGSFGEVYRAFDATLQRHVALKLLLPRGLNRDAELDALLQEARALARIRHPNVLAVYGVDRHEGRVGFWTDFVQGKTLTDLVTVQGSFGPREAALIGIDVCRAVGAVHAADLLHRDIKASNVMREEGGRILLMDFGLTHERGTDGNPSGTPAYMAPELLQGLPATIASDVYAVGVLLFHLLTAQYPVAGSDVRDLLAAHAAGRRQTLLDVRPDLPETLARVIDTAVSADPQKRFASTGLMIAALSDTIGFALPHVTPVLVPGVHEDYRRAHDLVEHYYRPRAIETAVRLLDKVVTDTPTFAPAFADLGRAYLVQFLQERDADYIALAREAASQALALSSDMVAAHVTLGELYAWTSQLDLARHEITEALRLDRFNASAHGALGILYDQQGNGELAERALRKAVSLAPDDWKLRQQLGERCLDRCYWVEAEEHYQRLFDLLPDNPRVHNNLGLVYRGQGRFDEATTAFQKSIDLEPSALRYRNLGMVLAEAGNYAEAAEQLLRAIEMRPAQYLAWGLLASAYQHLPSQQEKVRDTYLKAIALASDLHTAMPRNTHLLADVGGYYAALGMEREGRTLLDKAAALEPVAEPAHKIGLGYERLHDRGEALRWIEVARATGLATLIDLNPELTDLRADPRYGAATHDDR
jgi:serine/threonine protein kinase/Flp pilus assembly protein TadD